jgi:hypothetical protein
VFELLLFMDRWVNTFQYAHVAAAAAAAAAAAMSCILQGHAHAGR